MRTRFALDVVVAIVMFLIGYYISLVQAEHGGIWMILASSVFILASFVGAKLLFAHPLWEWGCLPITAALVLSAVLVYARILLPMTIVVWMVAGYFVSEAAMEHVAQDLP